MCFPPQSLTHKGDFGLLDHSFNVHPKPESLVYKPWLNQDTKLCQIQLYPGFILDCKPQLSRPRFKKVAQLYKPGSQYRSLRGKEIEKVCVSTGTFKAMLMTKPLFSQSSELDLTLKRNTKFTLEILHCCILTSTSSHSSSISNQPTGSSSPSSSWEAPLLQEVNMCCMANIV